MRKSRARGLVVVLALALDLLLGDPPNRWHPVAWMGNAIGAAERQAPRRGRARPLAAGALLVTGGAMVFSLVGRLVEATAERLPSIWGVLLKAVALKMTLSARGLTTAAGEVQAALEQNNLTEARRRLSWHLVSRDTSQLDTSRVAAATIESVAENFSDGIVAPLFHYALGGLGAALGYRFVNTADAMLGYRDPEHEWLGKVPARLDDVANLLPSRVAAGLLMLAAPLAGADAGRAWRIFLRDRGRTASPNAGRPMSAMAGALNVELEKVGHYKLGAGLRPAAPADVGRSVRLVGLATGLGVGLLVAGLSLACRDEGER
jgi:adenosylcobinamide-phosphate synthase